MPVYPNDTGPKRDAPMPHPATWHEIGVWASVLKRLHRTPRSAPLRVRPELPVSQRCACGLPLINAHWCSGGHWQGDHVRLRKVGPAGSLRPYDREARR